MSDDSYYDTSSSYDTTSYTTFDVVETAPTYDWSASSYDASAYVDPYATATGSYSYDSTDWSSVGEVSQGWNDVYQYSAETANSYYEASTQAWLEGDTMAAYEYNQAYLAYDGYADAAWGTSNDVWTAMDQTTTVTSYDTSWTAAPADSGWSASSYDTSWSASSYDTSWSAAPADTSWSAAPADTSWSAAPADTSWSAAPADTSWSASSVDTSADSGW